MDFIKPTEITDALLFGSNVPENDYQGWDSGTSYAVGNAVIVTTPDVHKIFECLVAQSAGLTVDILNENCSDISGWVNDDKINGVSEVSPAGQFRMDANLHATNNQASIYRTITSPPDTFSLEIKLYHNSVGNTFDSFVISYRSATWFFVVSFEKDGLMVQKDGAIRTEIGTNIVKFGENAAWQTWRFEVDKTVEADATVEVFLKEEGGDFVSQGTVDCDRVIVGGADGRFSVIQYGKDEDNMLTHIDYIKIATGLGKISTTNDTPIGNSDWLEIGATNRWACFDGTIGNQTSQATPVIHAIMPGLADSVALLNIESTSVEIVEIDDDDDLVTNGEAWTDATGTTQPTSWDKVGTPTDFTIDDGAIKITVDAANEGISQTIAVSAATEYQLLGKYKNTDDDIAQIAIYDVTNSANILATTDLTSSTVESVFSHVFTTPAGCVSVKISLMAKAAADIVWFDSVKLAPTEYSATITTGASKTDVVKTDLVQKANGIITVTVIYTAGTSKLGELIAGLKTNIGIMRYSPQVGITDYSTKTVDAYGHYSIVPRTFAKRMNCSLLIMNTAIDEVIRLLTLYRSTELVWIGDENFNSLIIYGFYKDFQMVFARPLSSDCALEIEGLT